MADYYSLLARAVANLPKSSPPSTRRAIYERARKALTNQLRSLKPQLPESDIAREERALDEAVARLEADFEPASGELHTLPGPATVVEAGEPALAASSPPMPAAAAEPATPPPAPPPAPLPPPPPRPPRPVQPPVSRMPAAGRSAAPLAPLKPPLAPPAPKPKAPAATTGLPNATAFKPPTLGPAAPPLNADDEDIYEPTLGAAQAPFGAQTAEASSPAVGPAGDRYEREPLRPTLSDGKRRATPTWIWIAGAVAVGFAGSIAVAAYLMRPALRDLTVAAPIDTPSPTTTVPPEKLPSRVGPATVDTATPSPTDSASPSAPPSSEASAPPEASPSPSASPEASSPPTPPSSLSAAPNAAPTVPIATRAAMLVATVADASKPAVSVGTAVWSIVPAPPGQPAAIGVKAEIDIPDLKMHVSMILRKNFDANLPASHTIDLRMNFDAGSPIKGVKDIALPLMRRDDPPAADALAGVRVKISDNYFLIGLNRGDADVARNVQEIGERAWFDFPMQLDDDRIAKLTFEKGGDGDKAVTQALTAWK